MMKNIWYWTRSVALISFVLVISSTIGFSNARAQRMRPKVVTYFPQAHGARAHGMSIQADGKIVVVGAVEDAHDLDFEWGLVRYKPDLSLDETFGIGGHVRSDVSGFASRDYLDYVITPNRPGSPIVVAGRMGSVAERSSPELAALARYGSSGILDSSFGADGTGVVKITGRGIEPHRVTALAVQSDGRIVVAGYGSAPNYANRRRSASFLARFRSNGTPDDLFGTKGVRIFAQPAMYITGIALQPDHKILLATVQSGDFVVLRLNSFDGSPDSTFGNAGSSAVADFAEGDVGPSDIPANLGVALQSNGRIIVAGGITLPNQATQLVAMARYTKEGNLDSGFGTNKTGKVVTNAQSSVRAMVVDRMDRILIGGQKASDFLLIRYTSDGVLDTSFGSNGHPFPKLPGRGMVTTDFAEFSPGYPSSEILNALATGGGNLIAAGVHSTSLGMGVAMAKYEY